jgi:hypothetical protein
MNGKYRLVRQDESGHKYLMNAGDDREALEREKERLEAGGHKQTYWVEENIGELKGSL